MNNLEYFKDHFDHLQGKNGHDKVGSLRQDAFKAFNKMGIPTTRNEEWKYTRVSSLFNKQFQLQAKGQSVAVTAKDLESYRLPAHENANQLVFVNGVYAADLSVLLSKELVVLPLEEAAIGEYKEIVSQHLGHSSNYLKDGINALNTALIHGGIFIEVKRGKITEHPVYIYNVVDSRAGNILAQPRSLVHATANSQVQIVETYVTLGASESFTNQVMEVVVEQDAVVEYYKIQNDASHASQVSTTHLRQIGKSHVHAVTVSLDGGIVRNNMNIVMEAEYTEAHLYGLYFPKGQSHIDNHTIVDNARPHCLSNELYKGILDDQSTGVFNGKIFVRQDAQKINAFQSNKNILLSEGSSVNTKPQLEIFADDVKCSHGCTIGRLDQDGLFYLRSRGVPEKAAKSLLVHAFATDVLEHVKLEPIRNYVEELIAKRLEF